MNTLPLAIMKRIGASPLLLFCMDINSGVCAARPHFLLISCKPLRSFLFTMPSSRGQVPSPSERGSSVHLQARLFASRAKRPIYTRVHTFVPSRIQSRRPRANSARLPQAEVSHLVARYPWVEQLNEDAHIQSRIHDCRLTVREGDKTHSFKVFYQNHAHLPLNHNLGHLWRGDITVMRLGTEGEVVNLRKDDRARVDWLVTEFIFKAKQGPLRYLPARLHLIRNI
ncbi:hypothetical protein D9619_013351 [Psilocybe cf. subviscida]|uniref:Uncharacterized protein n=1 Tax=Psilocybe cf. subviscida TaxID=2480587 RepID=A0A8H5BTZ0_9AGAR|nr:hypothetical protein D9619_013351 [Psilocybe cf. subviscida]